MPTSGEQAMPASYPAEGPRPGEARMVEQLAAALAASDAAPPLREHQLTCPAAIAPDRPCNCEGPVTCPCGALGMLEDEASYFLEAAKTAPAGGIALHLEVIGFYMAKLAERLKHRMTFVDSLRRGVGEPK
jgi:hypothetical protein